MPGRNPRPGDIYQHFKGNKYQVTAIAVDAETLEKCVVYQALYGEFTTYVRKYAEFVSEVDKEKYPEVSQEYRFELQGCPGESIAISPKEKQVVVEEIPQETIAVEAEEKDAEPEEEATEVTLDPGLLEFLDADTYEEKLQILVGLEHRITDEMITSMHHRITDQLLTTMAIASDIELEEGDLESRYQSLKNCLLTLDKYEISRD